MSARSPLRILMVGQFPATPGQNDGGVSAVISYLTAELARRPDLELVGARFASADAESTCDFQFGFPVHSIPMKPHGLITAYRYHRRRFAEIVRQTRPDIVHGQGADLSGMLARGCGCPAIVTIHGIIGQDARYKSRFADRLRDRMSSLTIEHPLVRQSKALIVISQYVRDYYGSRIRGKTYDIPNPVEPHYFETDPRPEPGRILYAGRVIPRKGVTDLVRSFAALNPSVRRKLVLAGSTSDALYVSSVRKLASDLGVSQELEWRGVLTDKELRAEFARAQMLVLPSHQETAPMVIAQAMASCIPVVATRICGIPYQVRDGESGLLFRPGDTATLTMHMQRLLEERMQALTMGIVGRQIALERFHVTRVADATISAYRDTIAQSQCSQ